MFLDGSTPLKVPAKTQNIKFEFEIFEYTENGGFIFWKIGPEWGRRGSPRAHTFGK